LLAQYVSFKVIDRFPEYPDKNRMADKTLAAAARQLQAVRLNAVTLDQLSADQRPRTIDESYALQDMLNELLVPTLGEPAGYKIGCTTTVMQHYLEIPHPCAGLMFKSTVFEAHGTYRADNLCRPGVECEIAVRLGSDMPNDRTYTARDCEVFVECVLPSIELVDDRWVEYRSVDVHSLIAENFFSAGCVVGNPVSLSFDALAETEGKLTVNGELLGAGRGADILGHPYEALSWLANHQARRGSILRAGDLVSLGSVVRTHWLNAGDHVEVEFEGLGSCALTLVD
jgi:2-oxo-3-hexenedioate decarboxylase/2-keto-4-pentenoate hydratase